MRKPLEKVGLQLYTLREALAKDLPGTLKKVSDIGYRELEFAGYYHQDIKELAAMTADLGLSAPSAHFSKDTIENDLDTAIGIAQAMGHKHIVLAWLEPGQRETLDQYKQLAQVLNKAGEQCADSGLQLAYHNHDFEFAPLDSIRPYDLLLQETDAAYLKMELDLYWVAKAGFDPLQYLSGHPDRFTLCHVKDMDGNGRMADVGSGVMDFAAILRAAKQAGVQHYFVEHDETPVPFQSIQNSFKAMSQLAV